MQQGNIYAPTLRKIRCFTYSSVMRKYNTSLRDNLKDVPRTIMSRDMVINSNRSVCKHAYFNQKANYNIVQLPLQLQPTALKKPTFSIRYHDLYGVFIKFLRRKTPDRL
ncbi:hypothetical protein AVEN_1349-1 [Araneus ventricosus]|uniref:Uncharacterized protein n=1 Tax=Araneus ventricosus TaxID=182803 RepID=A0A4Y2D4Z2_ARAVE|nr:hypothetical protein AVEN_1349-1 [Araneus ventricosus]